MKQVDGCYLPASYSRYSFYVLPAHYNLEMFFYVLLLLYYLVSFIYCCKKVVIKHRVIVSIGGHN